MHPVELTELLNRAQGGDAAAADEALRKLGDELRGLAQSLMRSRGGHTLQPTALVNEAYMRLVGGERQWASRGHFLSFVAQAMRSVLVDHARKGKALKRGADWQRQPLTAALAWYEENRIDLPALDGAMRKLAEESAREAQIVELRFFAGLTNAEAAEVLDVSVATVERDWTAARARLHRFMQTASTGDAEAQAG